MQEDFDRHAEKIRPMHPMRRCISLIIWGLFYLISPAKGVVNAAVLDIGEEVI